ncbi:hypothetical protein ACOMHN_062780 [Nucella lapillus]
MTRGACHHLNSMQWVKVVLISTIILLHVKTQGDTGILLHMSTQGDTGILLQVSTQGDTGFSFTCQRRATRDSPSRVNAGRHGILLHVSTQGDTGFSFTCQRRATRDSPSRVNAGLHGILLHVSTQGDTRSKQVDPVTRRNVPVVAVVSSVRHVRERTNHSTVAVTGDGGADQPLHSGSDGRRGSHSSDAGLSLTGLSSQGVGRGKTESPRRDATGQRGDHLASQPARGGGRGDGASCRRDVTGH